MITRAPEPRRDDATESATPDSTRFPPIITRPETVELGIGRFFNDVEPTGCPEPNHQPGLNTSATDLHGGSATTFGWARTRCQFSADTLWQ